MKTTLKAFRPTRKWIKDLEVGDYALDCFGNYSEVVEVFAKNRDINGKWFVCYYVKFGDNARISHSAKEGEVQCNLNISRYWPRSDEIPEENISSNIHECY